MGGRGAAVLEHQSMVNENYFAVPGVDSVDNVDWGDVIGNKDDTVGGTSLVSLVKSAGGGTGSHAPLFTGLVWYVDATQPDDTGDGQTPDTAKETMLAGLALMSAGDMLKVKSGTYDEVGMDLSVDGGQLLCEAGVIFADTTPGTCLVVSGAACYVRGAHMVQAGGVGLQVTGIGSILERCVAVTCTVGFDIDEHSTQMFNCVSAACTVTAFDIGERNTVLRDCYAPGSGGATRGFYLSAAAVTRSLLRGCNSVGNGTAGFECVTGTAGNSLDQCTSGAGDGRWVDADNANTWPGFKFDNLVHTAITFTGASATHNLFEVTGGVRLINLNAHIETVFPSPGARTMYVDLFSANGAEDITDSPGPDTQGLVAGTVLVRNAGRATQIAIGEPDGVPAVIENAAFQSPTTAIDIIRDDSAVTYVRMVLSNTFATGEIHWHAQWEPLTDDGFLAAV